MIHLRDLRFALMEQFIQSPELRNVLGLLILAAVSIGLFRYGTWRLRAGPQSNPIIGCACWFFGAILLLCFAILLVVAVRDLHSLG